MAHLTVTNRTYTEDDIFDGDINTPYDCEDMGLRDAYKRHKYDVNSADHWPIRRNSRVRFLSGTSEMDCRTGKYTHVTVAIPAYANVTPASSRRIARLFGVKTP